MSGYLTTLWAHELRYYPLQVMPYTPESRLAGGKQHSAFQTKPHIALALGRARASGRHDVHGGRGRLPYVLAHRGRVGRGWAPADVAHSFDDAARELPLRAWHRVERRFRGGHAERWWAAELTLFGYGPGKSVRAMCATTDRRTLPDLSTQYLTTNLPAEQAPLAEVVRLYGLRHWIEQSYKQMQEELGCADFMVRGDRAIRRHWSLVCCAFAFC